MPQINIPQTPEEVAITIQNIDGYISSINGRHELALKARQVVVDGYQSDLTAARAEVQTATDALNATITALTADVASRDATIAEQANLITTLEATIVDLTPAE